MSKPISADQLLSQLKKWNVKTKQVSGWKTRRRPASTGSWSDLKGVMWHHTGGDVSASAASGYASGLLAKGRSDLPGPLCQAGIGPDGTVYLIGWGRANHAGLGDPDVLNAVMNENYGSYPPRDNQATVDGNARFYGWEIMYSGSHGMNPAQYDAAIRLTCAILDYHDWSAKSVIGHGEWQPGKWDPGYKPGTMMDMNAVRNDIAAMLKSGGSKKPEPEKGDPVAGKKTNTYKEVWDADVAEAPSKSTTVKTNKTWKPISFLREIYDLCVEIRDLLKERQS